MAIPGAEYDDPRKIHAVVGMRFRLATNYGKKIPCVNFLVPGKAAGTVYMHMVPIVTRVQTSEFMGIWKAVIGKPIPQGVSASALASMLARKIIDCNGALRYLEVTEDGHRRWKGVEFVDLGNSHPGVMQWPEKALIGDDLFSKRSNPYDGPQCHGDVNLTVPAQQPAAAPDLSDL